MVNVVKARSEKSHPEGEEVGVKKNNPRYKYYYGDGGEWLVPHDCVDAAACGGTKCGFGSACDGGACGATGCGAPADSGGGGDGCFGGGGGCGGVGGDSGGDG
eukprot:10051551-Ditylum_brightwellii.AAC.1